MKGKWIKFLATLLILIFGFRGTLYADAKVSGLTTNTDPQLTDWLYWIDYVGGVYSSNKIEWGTILDDTKGNGDTAYLWSADKIFDQLALKVTTTDIDTAAELETVANLGAYASDILAATNEANFKSITNLEAGTDYNAYSAALNSISGLTETNGGIPYGTADNAWAWLAAGAEGTLLMGNGAGAPSFLAAGTAGYHLIANGAADPVWTAPTGTGSPVNATSPSLVTPDLGTPSALTLTNATGLPAAGILDANAGTDITADLEEETHASEHAPNGADPISNLYYAGDLDSEDIYDTNNLLINCGYFYSLDLATIEVHDFFLVGQTSHAGLFDGCRIGLLMNDADVTLDFDGTPGTLEGNAGTNYSGHATQIQYVDFIYEGGVWNCPTLTMGQTNALTLSAKIGMNTVTDADGFTMTAAQGYNYTVYATGAGTIVMPPVAQYMQFCVEVHAAAAAVLNPDASGTEDTIRLDGTALSQGDSITSLSAAGDIACCTYYAADTWSCITNGWTDTN